MLACVPPPPPARLLTGVITRAIVVEVRHRTRVVAQAHAQGLGQEARPLPEEHQVQEDQPAAHGDRLQAGAQKPHPLQAQRGEAGQDQPQEGLGVELHQARLLPAAPRARPKRQDHHPLRHQGRASRAGLQHPHDRLQFRGGRDPRSALRHLGHRRPCPGELSFSRPYLTSLHPHRSSSSSSLLAH